MIRKAMKLQLQESVYKKEVFVMSKKFKSINAMLVVLVLLSAFCISAYANENEKHTVVLGSDYENNRTTVYVDGEDGQWRYGTGIGFDGIKPVKTAYSNLDHNIKIHRSSCEIDGNYDNSGWVPARTTSYSNTKGKNLESVAYCNWDVQN